MRRSMNGCCDGLAASAALMGLTACGSSDMMMSNGPGGTMVRDPQTAEKVSIDRFSAASAHLMVRDANNGLPAANAPIDFDSGAPFVTEGLSPKDGMLVKYYNFDVQPTTPAPIYVLFHDGETAPVSGQLNIVDVIPGDAGYNDFWQVTKVTVPKEYLANTVTSFPEIQAAGYAMTATDMLVNCPVVPDGSTATLRLSGESPALTTGWYKDKVVKYFNFSEHMLTAASGSVPVSPIYVTFNKNPDEMGGGPSSGFKTEPGSMQTHNVPATLPADAAYSPLWSVQVYSNANFATVKDLTSALAAKPMPAGAEVNCPIVSISP
jgi:hypothetical protein